MGKFLLRLRITLSEWLSSDGYRKSMKISRILIGIFALIFGISAISGIREDTQAASRRLQSNDRSADGSFLAFDFQFIGQGQVSAGSDSIWLIGNIPIRVDYRTQLGDDLHPGDFVTLSGRISADQDWHADRIELGQMGESFYSYNAPLEAIGAERWLVGGHSLMVNPQTVIGENLTINDIVLVTLTVLDSGKWMALEIKSFDRFPAEPTPIPSPTPIHTPAPNNPVISDSPPNWSAKSPPGQKKKNPDSKGKKDSKSRGKSASHRKNKK